MCDVHTRRRKEKGKKDVVWKLTFLLPKYVRRVNF